MRIVDSFMRKLGFDRPRDPAAEPDGLTPEEMEFLPAALEVVEKPPSPIGRAIAWMLMTAFTVALIWAIVGKIDEVAVATGKIIPSGYTKMVQAEDKGVIRAIHVKEGSKVEAGDVLVELDTTITAADLASLQKERAQLKLEIGRLMAELSGRAFAPQQDDNTSDEDVAYQQTLYMSRTAAYQSKLAMLRESVRQNQAAVEIAQSVQEKLRQQLEIAADKEDRMLRLLNENAVSDFAYQDYKEKKITLQQDLSAQSVEIARANAALLESMENMQNAVEEQRKEIMTMLVEDRKQLKTAEEELKKAEEKNRLCTIKAPVAGTVQQMAIHTVGGVVTPAQDLMLVVPEGTEMEMEVWVDNQDIGFVYPDQKAEIKVATFNFQKFGTLDAVVTELSSDAVDDKEKGLVYRAVCKTDQNYVMVQDKKVDLFPGMAVTAEIKTRKKRVIEYFLDPFLKYKSEGLRER